MNVITALNRKYIPYTVVMLCSLGVNERKRVDAYLLHSELTKEDIEQMDNELRKSNVFIHPLCVDRTKFSSRLPYNDQWSIETYYRLMMLELLPTEVERALYLDGDMVINKELDGFYNIDFEDKEIIACDDKCGLNEPETYGPKHNEMFREAYENGYRYFNAGVMLLNVKKLREKYSFQTYLDAIDAWDCKMEAPDQDILNWVHWRKVGYADCMIYDLFARLAHNAKITYEEVKEAVAIVHFAGAKPWNNENVHFDIERLWWDYAKRTSYYERLLKDFVYTAVMDKTVELYIKDLLKQNSALKNNLEEIMKRMQNLVG